MKPKNKTIKLNKEDKAMLLSIAEKMKGRDLFPKSTAEAKRMLANVTIVSSKGQTLAQTPE
jgi:hypothetical protein